MKQREDLHLEPLSRLETINTLIESGAMTKDEAIEKLCKMLETSPELDLAISGLVEALESMHGFSKMNEYPEHEVRFALCCDVPQIAIDALAFYKAAVEKKL